MHKMTSKSRDLLATNLSYPWQQYYPVLLHIELISLFLLKREDERAYRMYPWVYGGRWVIQCCQMSDRKDKDTLHRANI